MYSLCTEFIIFINSTVPVDLKIFEVKVIKKEKEGNTRTQDQSVKHTKTYPNDNTL